MKMTFPHFGPVYLIVSLILKELEIPFTVPPVNSEQTLERGSSTAPEEMCLPFKFMAGNLMQAYEKGARRVIMPATVGPCRLGEYGELLKEVLDRIGYQMEWVLLDTPKSIGIREWSHRLKEIGKESPKSTASAIRALTAGMHLMKKLEQLEADLKYRAGYAKEPAACVRLMRECREALSRQENLAQGFHIIRKYRKELKQIPCFWEKDPVKILITGEIYTSIESAANRNLEEQLMFLGCRVKRPVTVSWWMNHTIKNTFLKFPEREGKYLPYSIGGYAKETVAEMRKTKEDGIIKIMPAGCMPEIVAKAVSEVMEEDMGLNVLHLIYDEMRGTAGYDTRIEAFVDMLERKKRVLSGN